MTARAVITLNLLLWTAGVSAQQQMIVVDAETKVAVRDVKIHTNNNQQTTTAWDGRFALPDSFSRINFQHPRYEQRYILKSELRSDTVWLLPKGNGLSEVVVWGERRFDRRMNEILKPSPQQKERDNLPQVMPAGPNILAIAAWLFDITFGKKIEARKKRKQALEEVRRKEAEVQQKWDMLRDTTAVHLKSHQ